MYRRHISDVTEEATQVTFVLVVRTADNFTTFGGGYVTLQKPVRSADLDAAVQNIVDEGDNAYQKKLTQADRGAMTPIQNGITGRLIAEMARQKNLVDFPGIGLVRGRRP